MPALKLTDDLGRALVFVHPPQRIVSLVPSDTYTIAALGASDRLVGRTTYCEPASIPGIAEVPTVGGTKNVDVDAVLALSPHLVVANQEENTRPVLEALAARVPVFVSLPRRVEAGIAHVARLARILGAPDKEIIRRGYQLPAAAAGPRVRAFIPIWMDPLMTLNADTYGSDVLARVGIETVFGDRLRLYPLAADLGKGVEAQDAAGRDMRYPRVPWSEVRSRNPEIVLLPDEPHAFTPADEVNIRAELPDVRIQHVSGKDLFWYGAWTVDAIARLAASIS